MYSYRIAYWTYEESEEIILQHEKNFSKEEFNNLIYKITNSIITSEKYNYLPRIYFELIFHELINILKNDYNFSEINLEQNWEIFGWGDLVSNKKQFIAEDNDGNLINLRKYLKNKMSWI